jgi:hypothetical protein
MRPPGRRSPRLATPPLSRRGSILSSLARGREELSRARPPAHYPPSGCAAAVATEGRPYNPDAVRGRGPARTGVHLAPPDPGMYPAQARGVFV